MGEEEKPEPEANVTTKGSSGALVETRLRAETSFVCSLLVISSLRLSVGIYSCLNFPTVFKLSYGFSTKRHYAVLEALALGFDNTPKHENNAGQCSDMRNNV